VPTPGGTFTAAGAPFASSDPATGVVPALAGPFGPVTTGPTIALAESAAESATGALGGLVKPVGSAPTRAFAGEVLAPRPACPSGPVRAAVPSPTAGGLALWAGSLRRVAANRP